MFADIENNNEPVCESCLRSCLRAAVTDLTPYPKIIEDLPDCEMDGGTSYSNAVNPEDCACWSCQVMAEG